MSDNSNKGNNTLPEDDAAALYRPYSAQPTSLVETSFASSLGLSMHNEVNSQQSARLTTLASTTNACKLMLQTRIRPVAASSSKANAEPELRAEQEDRNTAPPKKRFNLGGFFRSNKNGDANNGNTDDKQNTNADDSNSADDKK